MNKRVKKTHVQGEHGPWVRVEVVIPLGESWADRDLDCGWQGTQWNDGTRDISKLEMERWRS